MMPDKISVLHIRHASGSGGGADTVIRNIADSADRDQFSMKIAYLRKAQDDLSPLYNRLHEQAIAYYDLPGGRFVDIGQLVRLLEIVRTDRIHIVHCHDSKSDVYGLSLRLRLPALKIISTIHGWIHRRPRSVLYTILDQQVLKRFDAVIAVSRHVESLARSRGIRNLHVVHNGIDLDKWRLLADDRTAGKAGDSPQPFRIGFIGRISREKGPLDFVAIAGKILNNHPSCEFLVAGEGPEYSAMTEMAGRCGMINKFIFMGAVPHDQLIGIYRKLDLLLMPSYTEGLPMVILEAFAMSIPVIATDVGGISEVVTHGENGFLVNPGDTDAMAGNAIAVAGNPGLRTLLGANARRTVESRFSLKKSVKLVEDLYRQVMGTP